MKKINNDTTSKKLVTEFIAKFAKALMGSKASSLAKAMSKDPGLKDAFERYARESLRFQKHIQKDYGAVDPDELAKNLERTRNKYNR